MCISNADPLNIEKENNSYKLRLKMKDRPTHGKGLGTLSFTVKAEQTSDQAPGYKTFLMLNSTEHKISTAHKTKKAEK